MSGIVGAGQINKNRQITTTLRQAELNARDNRANHADSQMHLVVYGKNRGACMCMASCCYDELIGCICRSCNGRGHDACVTVNAKRTKDRLARQSAKSRSDAKQRLADKAISEGTTVGELSITNNGDDEVVPVVGDSDV